MEDVNMDERTGWAVVSLPDAAAGRIKRLERIGMLRDALLPKAMQGDLRSVATIIKCEDIEEKLFENFEEKRRSDSIALAIGKKPEELAIGPIFYTPGECAAILGVTTNTIRSTIQRGELAASLTPGGHHRILREEMGRYLAINLKKLDENSNERNECNERNESNATPQSKDTHWI
jgi:excisionase family DNA binding protein